jgi:rare lipoprotein A
VAALMAGPAFAQETEREEGLAENAGMLPPAAEPVATEPDPVPSVQGIASWYGRAFHGRRTASGERFDMYALTAAHKTLPLLSYVRVRNPDTGKSIVVRITDRGPHVQGRMIDLSYAAAAELGIRGVGAVAMEPASRSDFDAQPDLEDLGRDLREASYVAPPGRTRQIKAAKPRPAGKRE